MSSLERFPDYRGFGLERVHCTMHNCMCTINVSCISVTVFSVHRSIGIYLDTVNIFIRILTILMSSNSRKKR